MHLRHQPAFVTIRTKDTGVVKDSLSYGLWVNGQENLGGQMEVKGKSVTIHAEGEGQTDVRAIHVATNTLKPSQRSSLLIDADTVSITADGEGARAIVAMSTGVVEVKGKATIAADNAIVARGDAKVLVNAEGKYSTVINGNVNFSYDAPTSKTPVDATVILNLVGPESSWRGNTVVSWNGKPTSVDEYLSVTGMKLGLSKGAAWTPVETAKDSTTANVGAKYTALNLLENNDGVINITGSAIDVTVEKMTGTGGTVNLAADLTAEEGSRTGTITIAEADENSKIDVKLKDAKMERNLTSLFSRSWRRVLMQPRTSASRVLSRKACTTTASGLTRKVPRRARDRTRSCSQRLSSPPLRRLRSTGSL